MSPPTPTDLGSILLIGGDGFMGSFIIDHLLQDTTVSYTSITVAGLKSRPKTIPASILWHTVNISHEKAVRALLHVTKPRIIFHLASPLPGAPLKAFEECNIQGTDTLLRCAQEDEYVEALVLTSSVQVVSNADYSIEVNEETAELWTGDYKPDPYSRTKAIADTMVRNANGPKLKTAVLRLSTVYGGTDAYFTIIMDFLRQGLNKIQLGETSGVYEFVAAESAAYAHVLAAQAILSAASQSSVAGEAFFISEDDPDTWYGFARKVWAETGNRTSDDQIWKIPFWVLFFAAWVFEWVVYIRSRGRRGTETLMFNSGGVEKLKKGQHLLDTGKARRVLGYKPIVEREEGIRRSVRRNIERFEQRQKAAKH